MKNLLIILIILFILNFVVCNFALPADFEINTNITYVGYSGKKTCVIWDDDNVYIEGQEHWFEFQMEQFEQTAFYSLPAWKKLTEKQLCLTIPRVGHWIMYVRTCVGPYDCIEFNGVMECIKAKPTIGPAECSDWSLSTDPNVAGITLKDGGDPRAWWVYAHIAPPIIE